MMKFNCQIAILPLFLLIAFLSKSQQVDFDPFYYSGYNPPELNQNSADRLKKLYEQHLEEYKSQKGVDAKQFVYEYNYFLEQLNKSGKVFYGDSISAYLNALKDLIVEDPALKTKIRVYLVDYTYLNAFTNDFGNIYVNIATVAKLDSEEELMLLLGHEIGHIMLHHSYKTEENKGKIKKKDWKVNPENTEFEQHAFSRKQELQADSIAFELLKGKVNLSGGLDLFNKLKNAENPVFDGAVDLNLLAGNNAALHTELAMYWSIFDETEVYFPIADSDSLSTHPSIEKRIEIWNNYLNAAQQEAINYQPIGDFSRMKFIAANLLVNTYIEDDLFLEALDLTLKLRAFNPDDTKLKNQQIRILTLLAQQKYDENEFDRVLNIHGNACNNADFLRYKQAFMQLRPVDMNILAYRAQKALLQSDTSLLQNPVKKNYYQLYNENKKIFNLKEESEYSYQRAALVPADSIYKRESDFRKAMEEMKKDDFVFLDRNDSLYFSEVLLNTQQIDSAETSWINYVNDWNKKQETIYYSDIDLFIHPAVAARKYKKGEYYLADDFDPKLKTTLFKLDNFYFKSKNNQRFSIDYEKTLDLETQILALNARYKAYTNDYSNLNGVNVSVQDNYVHKIIWTWMMERDHSTLLSYSKTEEDFERLIRNKDLKYLVYTVCFQNKNRGAGRRNNLNYYEIYYDIDSQTIAYVSKLGSIVKSTDLSLENCIYQSNNHKTND